ncbi:MAG TPA: GAF domain-containing protein [Burkholderiales bacterium]|nr:GAF domain-containing protein [Burkholderiales bacterium]
MENRPIPNVSGATHRIRWYPLRKFLARVAIAFRRAEMPRLTQDALVEEARLLDTLYRVGNVVAAELDLDRVAQVVTDATTELTGSSFSAFFYNKAGTNHQSYWLYAFSGAERNAFADFPMPRNTALFAPTFEGEGVVRSDDIAKDSRYDNESQHNILSDHLPIRSYLAAPVVSRSGEVLGALFCGHPEVGVFSERSERLLTGVAAQAATALDNARLYQAAQRDIAERKKAEERLRRRELELAAIKDDLALQVSALTRMHELAMQLAGTLDLREALQSVLETVVEIHNADFGLLSLYDPQAGVLRTHASVGFDAQAIEALDRIEPAESSCGLAFSGRTRIVINDAYNDPRFSCYRQVARDVGFRAVHSTPIATGAGDVLGVITVQFKKKRRPTQREMQFADMCAHHAAEEIQADRSLRAQRESEERFKHMADHAPVLIWVNSQGGCDFVNSEYLRFAGKGFEEVHGMRWTKLVHPGDLERYMHDYQRAIECRKPFEAQCRFRHADGGYRWLRSSAMPRFGSDGEFLGYVGCSVDITEIKKSEDALKDADRRKDEFLATLAHELRNPLAPLSNGLQIMQLARHNPSAIEQARNMMSRQLKHMVRLVDDLLEVSRISSGKIILRKERTDTASVIHSAIETSRPFIEEARHEFIVTLPPEPLPLNADITRLAQVFANLLNNAAKYTDAGGRIHLTVEQRDRHVLVRVRDNGIGISPETLPQIFEMFAQADQSIEKSRGGLGVGLTLARHLVHMHDGTIEASSDGTGKGSEFIVRLPLALSGTAAISDADAPGPNGDGEVALRILVADDNVDSATSMEMLLEILGNRVCIANDGAAAVAAAKEFQPDVVMLDIGMPKMNGYDAAETIRRQPWGSDMVLVAVTGWGQDADKQRSKTVGFDYHLVKPIAPHALSSLMAAIRRTTRDRARSPSGQRLN